MREELRQAEIRLAEINIRLKELKQVELRLNEVKAIKLLEISSLKQRLRALAAREKQINGHP